MLSLIYRHWFLILFIVAFCGCSSTEKKPEPMEVIVKHVMEQKYVQDQTGPVYEAPASAPFGNMYQGALQATYNVSRPKDNGQHLVTHTCISTPIFDLEGQYVRSSVDCR